MILRPPKILFWRRRYELLRCTVFSFSLLTSSTQFRRTEIFSAHSPYDERAKTSRKKHFLFLAVKAKVFFIFLSFPAPPPPFRSSCFKYLVLENVQRPDQFFFHFHEKLLWSVYTGASTYAHTKVHNYYYYAKSTEAFQKTKQRQIQRATNRRKTKKKDFKNRRKYFRESSVPPRN